MPKITKNQKIAEILSVVSKKKKMDLDNDGILDSSAEQVSDWDSEDCIGYWLNILFLIQERKDEDGFFITRKDKKNLLNDLRHFKKRISDAIKECRELETFD